MNDKYRKFYHSKKYEPLLNTLFYQIIAVTAILAVLIAGQKLSFNYITKISNQLNEFSMEKISFFRIRNSIPQKPEKNNSIPEDCSLSPLMISVPLTLPVSGAITCKYGFRTHPVTGKEDFHRGIDIAVPIGTEILAPLGGTVEKCGEDDINGKYIILDHGNDFKTIYCHCDEIFVSENANIKKGERLGKSGNTGLSTGPHLHFEVKYKGISYNPEHLV